MIHINKSHHSSYRNRKVISQIHTYTHTIMISRLLLVVVFLSYSTRLSHGLLDPKTVKITNGMVPDTTLTVHCKSGDNDLGPQTLLKGQSFTFNFKVNLMKTTKFFCNFQWMSNDKVESRWADIFDAQNKETSSCTTCDWEVKNPDGVCRMKSKIEETTCFPWNPVFLSFKD